MEQLRTENAEHRTKAQRADSLAASLVGAWAEASSLLQDPSDMPVTDDLNGDDGLPDRDKVTAAIADLVARKPHLRSRRPAGVLPQGSEPSEPSVDLAGLLRAGAG